MAEEPRNTEELSEEELEEQEGEQLPDREVMSILNPDLGRPVPMDGEWGPQPLPEESL
jgi:hypothetical protein